MDRIPAFVVKNEEGNPIHEIQLHIADMTPEEREIVKAGCLINYNRNKSSQL
jgi:aconitate hydratase